MSKLSFTYMAIYLTSLNVYNFIELYEPYNRRDDCTLPYFVHYSHYRSIITRPMIVKYNIHETW